MSSRFKLEVLLTLTIMSVVSILLLTTMTARAHNQLNPIWNTTWGDTGYDYGLGVAVSGDIYLVGSTDYFGAGDAFLARYDGGGNQLWNTTWGGTGDDGGYGVAVGGGIYVTGYTSSFGAGGDDAFLAKYDGDGNQLWNTTWGGTGGDGGYGVAVGSDIYLVGSTSSLGAGYMDAFLVRYGFPPVGGVVFSTSPTVSLLYVAIALSIITLLFVAKIRRRILRFFFSL